MEVVYGQGTRHGPGVEVRLTGGEVAIAIMAYLVAHDVNVQGPRTVIVNGDLCRNGLIYVDPSGCVVTRGERLDGRGPEQNGPEP